MKQLMNIAIIKNICIHKQKLTKLLVFSDSFPIQPLFIHDVRDLIRANTKKINNNKRTNFGHTRTMISTWPKKKLERAQIWKGPYPFLTDII